MEVRRRREVKISSSLLCSPCVLRAFCGYKNMNDSNYQRAARLYRAALPPGEINEFTLTDADRLGVACHSAIFYPENGPHKGGVGYGASPDAAKCGAYGELTEDFWAHDALEKWPRLRASFAQLQADGRAALDPLSLCLEAGSLYNADVELEWVEINGFGSDDKVWVPIEFVACGWSDVAARGNPALGDARRGYLVTPITNGLGAGTSHAMAVAHGLLELLQRDGNGLSIRALATTTAIDPATIGDARARELLDSFEAAGVDVVIKLASTDYQIPGFYVTGIDRVAAENGASGVMALAGGEAAHPVAAVALRKALNEFAAARARIAFFHGPLAIAERIAPAGYVEEFRANFLPANEEARALETLGAWSKMSLDEVRAAMAPVHRVEKWLDYADVPTQPLALADDETALLNDVVERLRADDLEVYVADFSPPGDEVFSVKVIVPGLEVETLSYGRIGARNVTRLIEIARAGGPILAGIGAQMPGAMPVLLSVESEAKLGGAAWFDADAAARVVGPLYPIYREPGRHAVALAAELEVG